MRTHVYFLAFRHRADRPIRVNRPTGGLVMKAERFVEGIPLADFTLARDVFQQRYHCQADEILDIAEVFGQRQRRWARRLHRQWERDLVEFAELMVQ